jgi:hypothetical protein
VCIREHQKDAASVGLFVFRISLSDNGASALKRLGNGIAGLTAPEQTFDN